MIKKLPHWAVTDLKPAFYDTESFTVIEQTANLFAKVEELIEDYNAFVDSTNTIIETFINNSNANFEEFQVAINQNITEFITLVEQRITAQNVKIDTSIAYIRENLATYLINNVRGVLIELIEAGTLDQTIIDIFDSFNASILTMSRTIGDISTLNTDITEENSDPDFCCTVNAINIVDNKLNTEVTARESLANDVGNISNIPESFKDNGEDCCVVDSLSNVKSYIDSSVGAVATLDLLVVETLPTESISTSTIYLLPNNDSINENVYDEYIYINNTWEHIGSTSVDLSNYLAKNNTTAFTPDSDYEPATKKYVDDSITNVDVPDVDLTNYLAKNNTTAFTPDADYEPATKKYVDDSGTFIESFFSGPEYQYPYPNPSINGLTDQSVKDIFSAFITKCKTENKMGVIYQYYNSNTNYILPFYLVRKPTGSETVINLYSLYGVYHLCVNGLRANDITKSGQIKLTVNGSWIDNAFVVSSITRTFTEAGISYLSTNNTFTYTPTTNYNPATKKYVDDKFLTASYNSAITKPTGTLGEVTVFQKSGFYFLNFSILHPKTANTDDAEQLLFTLENADTFDANFVAYLQDFTAVVGGDTPCAIKTYYANNQITFTYKPCLANSVGLVSGYVTYSGVIGVE